MQDKDYYSCPPDNYPPPHPPEIEPPVHNHYNGSPIARYPLEPPHPNHCYPEHHCPPHGHDCAGDAHDCTAPVQKCHVVPPPVPPVRYVPGMNVQEQLNNMADQVNVCIDRWNAIQHNCFDALNRVVGAAVSNDVYYDQCEIKYTQGYSENDGCNYQLVEAMPLDRCGRPIIMRLVTAYNAGQGTTREQMSDVSFVTSANAVITARMTAWSGLCMVKGNPVATTEGLDGTYYAGWNDKGHLIILPNEEATIENAKRRRIDSLIGPVIPIVRHGKVTDIAANFSDNPASIQAIGFKKCNGVKVMFSCGMENDPGCTVKNVADILVGMGVTEAVITCYQTGYNMPDIGVVEEKGPTNDNDNENGVAGQADYVTDELGLTGGMMFIGKISSPTFNFQLPANSAFWVISKRPFEGWHNRFTGEIADIAQRLGSNANELESINGKLDIEWREITKLQNRVTTLETNDAKQDDELADHANRISTLESEMDKAQEDINNLFDGLNAETKARIEADEALDHRITKNTQDIGDLRTQLAEEITARNLADQNLINALNNESNTRATADQFLQSQIDNLTIKQSDDIQKEKEERVEADQQLQEQIDELQKNTQFTAGPGIIKKIKPNQPPELQAHIGSGIRFDSLQRIAVNTGPGIGLVNGQVVPILSDDFIINDKGEIEMVCNCCGDEFNAGTGLSYSVDPETGEKSLNIDPPKNGEIGGVKAGANVTILPDGTINASGGGGGSYTLPPATKTTLGGIMVGDNLSVDENGKVNAPDPYVLPIASTTQLGGVRAGKNIIIDEAGIINAEIPENPGDGDTVLQGDGIYVEKDASNNTATVSLSSETQATLAQVGENKEAIDALRSSVNQKVDTTRYNQEQNAQNTAISEAAGDAKSAVETASQAVADVGAASQAAQDALTAANEAKTSANEAKELIASLSYHVSNIDNDIQTLSTATQNNSTAIATNAGNINTLSGGLNTLTNKVNEDDNRITALESKELPIASNTVLGGVKIGSGINVAEDGTISAESSESYELPTATSTTLGGVKIGSGISVKEDGTISAESGGDSIAQGTGISVTENDGVKTIALNTQYLNKIDNAVLRDGSVSMTENLKFGAELGIESIAQDSIKVIPGISGVEFNFPTKSLESGAPVFGIGANINTNGRDVLGFLRLNANSDIPSSLSRPTLRGVGDPRRDSDAANKKYVDNSIKNVAETIDISEGFSLSEGVTFATSNNVATIRVIGNVVVAEILMAFSITKGSDDYAPITLGYTSSKFSLYGSLPCSYNVSSYQRKNCGVITFNGMLVQIIPSIEIPNNTIIYAY